MGWVWTESSSAHPQVAEMFIQEQAVWIFLDGASTAIPACYHGDGHWLAQGPVRDAAGLPKDKLARVVAWHPWQTDRPAKPE